MLLRIIQGIGVGGEFGGATSLLAEFGAKRRSRAFWMSLANLGFALGLMAASAVFLLLSKTFATHRLADCHAALRHNRDPSAGGALKTGRLPPFCATQAAEAARQDAQLRCF